MGYLTDLIGLGAPVKGIIPAEGTWMTGGAGSNIAIFNKRPHPNATKIFVNWLLSKEAQTTLARLLATRSLRLDVPTDHLSPDQLWKEGGNYYYKENETSILGSPARQKKAQELFSP